MLPGEDSEKWTTSVVLLDGVQIKFVSPHKILPFSDANWGGQDQSHPDPNHPEEVSRFSTRSMSGFLIYDNGPLHWVS